MAADETGSPGDEDFFHAGVPSLNLNLIEKSVSTSGRYSSYVAWRDAVIINFIKNHDFNPEDVSGAGQRIRKRECRPYSRRILRKSVIVS
jgi:hypothetical protein